MPSSVAKLAQVAIAGKDGVIEAIDRRAVFQDERPGQPAQHRRSLKDFDLDPLLREEIAQADAHDPAANDSNVHRVISI